MCLHIFLHRSKFNAKMSCSITELTFRKKKLQNLKVSMVRVCSAFASRCAADIQPGYSPKRRAYPFRGVIHLSATSTNRHTPPSRLIHLTKAWEASTASPPRHRFPPSSPPPLRDLRTLATTWRRRSPPPGAAVAAPHRRRLSPLAAAAGPSSAVLSRER
jgi:hypothetical protein